MPGDIEPFDFESVYRRAVQVQLDNCIATVIPIADLISLKRSVGRPRDLEDIAALCALAGDDGKDN